MPERITGKKIRTLGELRDFVNNTLGDLEDDYEFTLNDNPMYTITLLGDCDISYSSKSLTIDCEVEEFLPFHS